jgi:hypothetical protein
MSRFPAIVKIELTFLFLAPIRTAIPPPPEYPTKSNFLPLDIFHNHDPIPQSSGTEKLNSPTSHELNVQNKVDYCWVCAVHFDKTFTKSSFFEKIKTVLENKLGYNRIVAG